MASRPYNRGLHQLNNGCWAWVLPNGSWGLSNAGLIVDGNQCLAVDTLYDKKHTREMLDAYKAAIPAARDIGTLVNTHANGDHYFGNELLQGSRIIASRAAAEDMPIMTPAMRADALRRWEELGDAGKMLHEVLAPNWDFDDTVLTLPTEVFEERMSLKVGDKPIELYNVGPAHTRGDVLVHVPKDRVCYTGDILFADAHPVIWDGPVDNWIRACDLILSWDVETIVPGHGPVCDKSAVRGLRHYFEYLQTEVRKCWDAKLSEQEAIAALTFDPFRGWLDPERVIINVNTLYREYRKDTSPRDILDLYGQMHRWRHAHGHQGGHVDHRP